MISCRTSLARNLIRSVIYLGLWHSGVVKRARTENRSKVRILLYHRIAPRDDVFTKGLELVVRPSTFEKQLLYLREHYEMISLSELARQVRENSVKERQVIITFDDGFRDVFLHAFFP